MPPRDPSLPEGTDKIIDTNAIDTGGGGTTGGGGGSTSSTGGTGASGQASGGGTTSGTAGGNTTGTTSGTAGGNTTGTTADTSQGSGSGGSAFTFDKGGNGDGRGTVSKTADTIVNQLKEQVGTLKSTGTDRARSMADDGKRQATDFLQTIAEIIQDAASSVEEKLGSQYSGYGTRAADGVNSLASKLNERSVDDLVDDAREFIRKSPAAAIGIAAVVGFAVARVVRAGVEDARGGTSTGSDNSTGTGTGSSTGTSGTGSA
ncbi:MAG: hypothetical protein ACK4SZ_03400 [Allosphingosinicella sp.]|uniref:hypothetical protein n=1 Tax=Allosphingosinicella sp. TaxID=2823234 RepID=UPI00392CD7F1